MCLTGLLLADLECLVHAERRVAARHGLLLALVGNLLESLLRLGLSRALPMELVRERLPRLLGRQLAPELVIVDDVHVRLVVLERLEVLARLLLLALAVLVLARRLVLVPAPRPCAFEFALREHPPIIREPQVALQLHMLALSFIGVWTCEYSLLTEDVERRSHTGSERLLE